MKLMWMELYLLNLSLVFEEVVCPQQDNLRLPLALDADDSP